MTTFDPERRVRWDELSPSLQARFNAIQTSLDTNMNYFESLVNNYRITISTSPPIHPEPNRDVWWDLNYNCIKFYMDRDGDGTNRWEISRGAWYGGSSSDVKAEKAVSHSTKWSRVKTFTWVSNVAVNNTYTAENELTRTMAYTVLIDGWYKLRDNSTLFEYNEQKRYSHDGGRMTVVAYKRAKGTTIDETIYNTVYDSRVKHQAYDEEANTYPEETIYLEKGDIIMTNAITNRDPVSTDDVEIYQISNMILFRLNYGDPQTGYTSD